MNIQELEERFKQINKYIENDTVALLLEEIIEDLETEESIGEYGRMFDGKVY